MTMADREVPSPSPLMNIVGGAWAAKTLAVAVQLDLFTQVSRSGGLGVDQLREKLGIESRPADILLTACASLGLLTRRGDYYVNSVLSETYLVRGVNQYFGYFIELADQRSAAWQRLGEAVRTNRPITWDPDEQSSLFTGEDLSQLSRFWDGMYSLSISTAEVFASQVDLSGVTRLLDAGGGGAAYDIQLCRRYPQLKTTVFDLPYVCDLTAKKISEAGLSERIALVAGDFFSPEPMPGGHDAVLMSMVLHILREPECRTIIDKCVTALEPGGLLIITELFVDDNRDGPPAAALMGVNMLLETMGRNYTWEECRRWLVEAGLVDLEVIRFDAPGVNGAILARKP